MWSTRYKLRFRLGLQIFVAAFFGVSQNAISKELISGNIEQATTVCILIEGDTLKSNAKKPVKKDEEAIAEVKEEVNDGVTINVDPNAVESSGNSGELLNFEDEEFEVELIVNRELVLEQDYKLVKIIVHRGRKVFEYKMIEQPFGTYYKKNDMDITEEHYLLETSGLPEGETTRYTRDEYEAIEKRKYEEELRKQMGIIETLPIDVLYNNGSNGNSTGTTDPENSGTTETTDPANSGTTETSDPANSGSGDQDPNGTEGATEENQNTESESTEDGSNPK